MYSLMLYVVHQALTRSSKHDNKQEEIDRQLEELEVREEERQERERSALILTLL